MVGWFVPTSGVRLFIRDLALRVSVWPVASSVFARSVSARGSASCRGRSRANRGLAMAACSAREALTLVTRATLREPAREGPHHVPGADLRNSGRIGPSGLPAPTPTGGGSVREV